MLKKTIKYKDFNEKEREEDFYFNLTRAEISKMALSTKEGLHEYIKEMVERNDGEEIIQFFEKILRLAYGERSADGRTFDKSEEKSAKFMNSAAYDVLFMELITDSKLAAEFMNGIVPKEV